MNNQATPIPIELRAPRGADTVEIDWADGHTGVYPNATLRGFCPCAGCQGHEGPIRFRAGGDSTLSDIEQVGNYGIRLVWADGHGSGIYRYAFLRELCACGQCNESEDILRKTFAR